MKQDDPIKPRRLTATEREEISRVLSATRGRAFSKTDTAAFIALLEIDLAWLLKPGRGNSAARRQFAMDLAVSMESALGIVPGRGRNGSYYRVLMAALGLVGIHLKDAKRLADAGVSAVLIRTGPPLVSRAEINAWREDVAQRGHRATVNRRLRRKQLKEQS